MKKMRNPVQGVRSLELRSTCPAWGASSLATGRTGDDLPRGPLANPVAVNSSTMKGPRGLAGESCGRRSRIAKDLSRWVRGCFHVRSPEMIAESQTICDRNYAGSGELDIRLKFLPVTRDSDVSRKVKGMANAGSSAVAGVVPGAWRGQPSASNAVEWECGLIRSRFAHWREPGRLNRAMFPARQWGLVGVVTGGADGHATTKGLTGSMYLSKICAGDFAI
jgi:hypothetical protein